MMLVRVIAAIARPAIVGGTLTATVAGSYIGYDRWRGDDVTPFQQIQSQGQRLLISEFGEDADTIVAINPDDTTDRTEIATVEHARGYGIFATLSPDGEAIAYTALPASSDRPAPDTPAQTAVVEVDGDVTLLADDVDLLIPPVWSPDSQSIVVRKNVAEEDGAGSFELIALARDGSRSTITSWSSAAVFPIDFAPDGSKLYFATLNENGTDLYSVAPDGAGETLIAHLSDEIARDWRLSPDGATLAYSVAESGDVPRVVTLTLDLASGDASRVTTSQDRMELNPAWNGDGELTISSVKPGGGSDAISVDAAGGVWPLSRDDDAIDLPLSWSPDGAALAVRTLTVDGAGDATQADLSSSYVELMAGDERERVSDVPDVLIVGWTE
jgi:Tol biopolymer transport system component